MSRFCRKTFGSPWNSRLSSSSRSLNGSRTSERNVARVASKYALELSRSIPSNHATRRLPNPVKGTARAYGASPLEPLLNKRAMERLRFEYELTHPCHRLRAVHGAGREPERAARGAPRRRRDRRSRRGRTDATGGV